MRGRKPTHLRVLDGNPGDRSLHSRHSNAVPTCPAHLSPIAKAEWKRLVRQLQAVGLLTALDRAVLAGYCQAYGRWVEAERKLKEMPPSSRCGPDTSNRTRG